MKIHPYQWENIISESKPQEALLHILYGKKFQFLLVFWSNLVTNIQNLGSNNANFKVTVVNSKP